jgi:hypothetical protein
MSDDTKFSTEVLQRLINTDDATPVTLDEFTDAVNAFGGTVEQGRECALVVSFEGTTDFAVFAGVGGSIHTPLSETAVNQITAKIGQPS